MCSLAHFFFCYSKWLLHFRLYLCTALLTPPWWIDNFSISLFPTYFPYFWKAFIFIFFGGILTCDKKNWRKSILFGCLFGLWFVGCVFSKTGYFRRGRRRRILLCVCVDDCAEALWMAVCVLYSVTLSLLLLLLLPPSPFVNVGVGCRSEKRKSTSAANEEAEREVCRVGGGGFRGS